MDKLQRVIEMDIFHIIQYHNSKEHCPFELEGRESHIGFFLIPRNYPYSGSKDVQDVTGEINVHQKIRYC